MQITGKRRKDPEIESAPTFPNALKAMQEYIAAFEQKYNTSAVVLVGHNFYSVDHPWLLSMCIRHNIEWPSSWKWGWDTLRTIK